MTGGQTPAYSLRELRHLRRVRTSSGEAVAVHDERWPLIGLLQRAHLVRVRVIDRYLATLVWWEPGVFDR